MLRILFQSFALICLMANFASAQCYAPDTQPGCPGGVSQYCHQKICVLHWWHQPTESWVTIPIPGAETMVRCEVDETLQHASATGPLPKAKPLIVSGEGHTDYEALATVTCIWKSQCSCPDREKAIGTLCGGGTQSPLDTRVPTQPDVESKCVVTVTEQ